MISHVGWKRRFSQGQAVWEPLREGRPEDDPGGGALEFVLKEGQ